MKIGLLVVILCVQRVSVVDRRQQLRMSGEALLTDPVSLPDIKKLANTQDQRKPSLVVSRNSHILDRQTLLRDQIRVLQFTAEAMFEIFGAS